MIRAWHADDLPDLISITEPTGWTEQQFLDAYTAGYCCWVIEKHAQTIGFAMLSVVMDQAEILNIAIRPQHQKLGSGKRLLQHALEQLPNAVTDVFLEVRASNRAAIQLYETKGFKLTGRRKQYYSIARSSQREDALLYQLQL